MNDHTISFLRRRILVRHHPSAFLLGAQLLSLVLYAAFDGVHSGRALLGAFSAIVLALAVWVVSRTPATNWIAWAIAIPAFLLSLLSALFVDPHLLVWSSLLEAALYFYTAGSLIAYMMGDHQVTIRTGCSPRWHRPSLRSARNGRLGCRQSIARSHLCWGGDHCG